MVKQAIEQDLAGKVYIVTGANSGIGLEASRNFASRGATLALVCRSEQRGRIALDVLKSETQNEQIRLFVADFSSLTQVARVARELLSAYPEIHVLCNNAGGANGKRVVTEEGFETTLVANHLSGFLLTKLLMPALVSAGEKDVVRVVFTSSLGHKNSPLDFDDLNLENSYTTLKAYGRSKLMNLLTARSLHERFRDKNIIASSFHPGAVRTAIWGKGGILARLIGLVMYPFMWSIERGADTFIWLASSDEQAVLNADGKYFFDRKCPSIAEFATDDAAEQLWYKSEELIAPWL